MKAILITLVTLLYVTGNTHAQIEESAYYSCNFTATDTPTDFLRKETTTKNAKIVVTEFRFEDNKWQKTDKNEYSRISDSEYRNENLTFNKNTIWWNAFTPYKIIINPEGNDLYHFAEYNYNATVLREGYCKNYFPLIKHGEVKEYYTNGKISSISNYENNRLLSSKRWMIDGRESINNVYSEVDRAPEFEGKLIQKFYAKMRNNIYYFLNPDRESYVNGICKVEFIIQKDGSISNIQYIENSDFPEIDYQVYKFILKNKDDWSPAEICNKKVDYVMQISYAFEDTRAN